MRIWGDESSRAKQNTYYEDMEQTERSRCDKFLALCEKSDEETNEQAHQELPNQDANVNPKNISSPVGVVRGDMIPVEDCELYPFGQIGAISQEQNSH
jgi:hypothetical protein